MFSRIFKASQEQGYDLWSNDTHVGTVRLIDGKLKLEGDVEGMKSFMDLARRERKAKTDAEVFAALPDMYHGTTHLRTIGNRIGLDKPCKLEEFGS